MPPKKTKNVLLLVGNIGKSSTDLNSLENEPFIDKTKFAMKVLVEKKIFLQPKDEIGIITMGDETDNPEGVDNVKLYNEYLCIPNWEMVKYIQNFEATDYSCNWVEALHVALCFIQREVLEPSSTVFMVIFNNFKEDVETIEEYDSNIISNELKTYGNLRLIFVGENSLDESNASEKFAMDIIEQAGAQFEKIDDFIETRQFYVPPPTNPIAWKVNLEWAGLEIPCATYVKTTESPKLSSWKIKASADDSEDILGAGNAIRENHNLTNVVKEKVQMDAHRNEIDPRNIINGYKFGGRYIPFTDEDEMAMQFLGGPKSLKVYGFVPQNQVKLEYWTGKGSRIIVPDSEVSSPAFYSMVKAMVDKKYVAIVRKVYAANNLPRMGVLFPKIEDDEIWGLVHIELPFIHDLRVVQKGMVKPGDKIEEIQKIKAIEDYIESMTISTEELPYLNPGSFPNVKNQYQWNAVAERVINPKKPLLPLNNYIKKYLDQPEILKNKAKPHLEKLNELFGTREVKNANLVNQDSEESQKVPKEPANSGLTEDSVNFFSPDDVDVKMEELDDF